MQYWLSWTETPRAIRYPKVVADFRFARGVLQSVSFRIIRKAAFNVPIDEAVFKLGVRRARSSSTVEMDGTSTGLTVTCLMPRRHRMFKTPPSPLERSTLPPSCGHLMLCDSNTF